MRKPIVIVLLFAVVNLWGMSRNEAIDNVIIKIKSWKTELKNGKNIIVPGTTAENIKRDVEFCIANIRRFLEKAELSKLNEYCETNVFKRDWIDTKTVKPTLIGMLTDLKNKGRRNPPASLIAMNSQGGEPAQKQTAFPSAADYGSEAEPPGNDGILGRPLGKQSVNEQEVLPLNVLEANSLRTRIEEAEKRVELMEGSMHGLNNWALVLLLGWVVASGLILVLLIALRMQGRRLAGLESQVQRLIRK